MNKVLIIGGGRSGRRFCESLLLYSKYEVTLSSNCNTGQTIQLSKQFNLKFLLYSRLSKDIMKFDVVIIATPLGTKSQIIKDIVSWGYNAGVIIEKSVSINSRDFNIINKLIKNTNIRCIIPYNRRYMKLDIPISSHYDIKVPTMERSNAFIHQIPHILDLLLIISGGLSLKIFDVIYLQNKLILLGQIGISSFRVSLYICHEVNDKVVINGKEQQWLVLGIYNKMVQDLLVRNKKYYYYEKKEQIIFNAITYIIAQQPILYTID